MSEFKVGDLVHRVSRCTVSQEMQGMQLGRHYRITEFMPGTDDKWFRVVGASGWYHAEHFKGSHKTILVSEIIKESGKALDVQHGGDHYKKLKIQPVEYIMANNIPYMEGNVIKYLTRWREKGGVQDLNKAKHYIEMLIENEEKNSGQK